MQRYFNRKAYDITKNYSVAELEAAKTGPSQTIAASVSNVTSAPTNNNVVSSTVIQQPLSQASAVLGSITSR